MNSPLQAAMNRKLVECIPNFSEGRRTKVIDTIVEVIAEIPGSFLLDRSSDIDHNRSVVTFAGSPTSVSQAAFAAISTAAELIDMDSHRGEHPRMGATDVVPLVPLSGMTMLDCVQMARALGQRVGCQLGIPVYLYEQAAFRLDRSNLADVRRGEYEGIRDSIAVDPDILPDFGPGIVKSAGVTAIGARAPLIAFNVYLTTTDVRIAKLIAKSVRHSSGGMPFVRALGMSVGGLAQVSMNLVDYRRAPVAHVVERISREAASFGVAIQHSEIVGLIPREALVDVSRWHLPAGQVTAHQVIETRLLEAVQSEQDVVLDIEA